MTSTPIERTLQSARGALTPSSNECARVLERLGARFPELGSSGGLGSEATPQPRPELLSSSGARAGFWRTIRGTGASGVSLGAGLVAAGFIAGYALKAELSALREQPDTQTVAPAAANASADPPAERATEHLPPEPSEPTQQGSEPVADASPPRDRRARPNVATPRAAAEPAPSDPRRQLEQELLALQRAERALRNDNAALALALLDELDARYARPLLGEERSATRSMAACQAGSTGAVAAARTFLDSHPRSVYGDRIRAACQLETGVRNSSDPATDGAPHDIDGR